VTDEKESMLYFCLTSTDVSSRVRFSGALKYHGLLATNAHTTIAKYTTHWIKHGLVG